VSVFTLLQAEILGIEEKYLVDVGMAALLHDIGRLSEDGEPVEEKLGPEMTHSDAIKQRDRDVHGAKILLDSEGIPKLAAVVAFEKNMRYDLKGLPRKIFGKELNLVSMMIAISDYYDRLRKQPGFYEEGGPEKAYEEMMGLSGTYFQPDLIKNFFSVVGIYPPGTLVELDTQEIALVIQGNVMDIRRPQVEILYDATGKKYETPLIANLIERDSRGQFRRTIVKSISMTERFQQNGSEASR
jgi:response regulator RpfG family c-di-GMP phosphodiesterase